MLIRLEANDRKQLIDLLINIPELLTERGRRQILEIAGLDDFSKRIDLSGDPKTVVSQIVSVLSSYGRINEYQTALELFLTTIKEYIGYEQQAFIDQLLDKYHIGLNKNKIISSSEISLSETSINDLKEQKSLSGQQQEKLRDALINTFPRKSSLEQLLWFGLNKNLDAIAGGGNLEDIVFNLIITAASEGWVEDLIRAAIQKNPGNSNLRNIAQELLSER
ncbi:hypothetical protein F7734_46570 [Scytonema sp. UIC 10036]|uniref:effector-associated domain EAD1-containing protein n=1 Tax=Scytonema sp. UIC 10036 TaxID=2304196 RepID=UPI0012DAF20C|nr:effector-associated domain EAD1-containing protein [Scytonema sp. UIC 10036]MUG99360.1 hypothetical protein [Scytonema sp. UIC 10036]